MRLPAGVAAAGAACGIKGDGSPDVGLLAFDRPSAWAGTFTTNAAAAAPVLWCREHLGEPARALVVNSGNANACTGRAGENAVDATATAVADSLGCSPREVLVASTGPIGVPLPVERITTALPSLVQGLETEADGFARSILTTDSTMKVAGATAGNAEVLGVGKGAAMVAPNMATMLAFVSTDAALEGPGLQEVLSRAVDRTFNRISVDACESTNDSVFLFSTGAAGPVDAAVFEKAVEDVCASLAEQMVRDAEGGSKLVRIRIEGADDEPAACALARGIAASDLWRAAAGGSDPNWGRILSALGSVRRDLRLPEVQVWIGSERVFALGEPSGSLEAAAREMSGDEFVVRCSVGAGPGSVEFLTADLTEAYVRLNATGTS